MTWRMEDKQADESSKVRLVTVYGLCASDDKRIRYVGQTKHSLKWRLKYHLVGARRFHSRHISKWINSVGNRNCSVEIFTIEENAIENIAERRWIAFYRKHGVKLVNGTDGGEGCAGHITSLETRAKLRLANLGKKHTQEMKDKISALHTGMKRPEGTGEKIAASKRGKSCPWVSERNNDPVFKERSRLARIARWAITPKRGPSLEARGKLSASMRGRPRNAGLEKWWAEKRRNHGLEI